MDAALDHWPSPPPQGWTADDLDRLGEGPDGEPGFFERVELIDGALVFAAPQTRFHQRVLTGLAIALKTRAPERLAVVTRMDVKLGHRMRPCPDVVVVDAEAADDDDRTFYTPGEVHLAVEVVSPESEDRDRKTKPSRYAEAGIAHFWRVENNGGSPVVYVYELDPATHAYALTGIHHDRLTVPVPFPLTIDLGDLPR
ncbi:Uma2 family endonuclease [Streptosporangium sp. NPDC002524]|uniref:Uma2 family endonuclease n=1 Tax=Streptosporangium sp. NPDC002524 TaxID=3154537 RepID=UPI00331A33B7